MSYFLGVKNRAISSLASDVTDVATTWILATGEGAKFPATGDFHVTCEDEIVKVTARSTDTLTVTRAQEGTTGAAHTAGKAVELRITAGIITEIQGKKAIAGWTANKLLKGAGIGANPTEVDVPSADFPQKQKPALTRYVMPGWYSHGAANITITANVIYYIPIFVEETTTYIRICINTATDLAGTADLRIFAWNDGVPGALILSAGTVDTTTAGAKEIIISQELTRGYYFLAIRCNVGVGIYGLDTSLAVSPPLAGFQLDSYPCQQYCILTITADYTDPALAPTGGTSAARAFVYLREN